MYATRGQAVPWPAPGFSITELFAYCRKKVPPDVPGDAFSMFFLWYQYNTLKLTFTDMIAITAITQIQSSSTHCRVYGIPAVPHSAFPVR